MCFWFILNPPEGKNVPQEKSPKIFQIFLGIKIRIKSPAHKDTFFKTIIY